MRMWFEPQSGWTCMRYSQFILAQKLKRLASQWDGACSMLSNDRWKIRYILQQIHRISEKFIQEKSFVQNFMKAHDYQVLKLFEWRGRKYFHCIDCSECELRSLDPRCSQVREIEFAFWNFKLQDFDYVSCDYSIDAEFCLHWPIVRYMT